MKPNIARTICVSAVLVLGAAAVASAEDDRTCSNGSLAGAWGYTETGTVMPPTGAVPAAAVGRYTFDDAGNFSGTQDTSTGGMVAHDTKQGTFIVNPDCTGTLTLGVYDPSGNLLRSSVWAMVLVDQGKEIRSIMTSLVLANGMSVPGVMTMTARKLFPGRGDEQ